GQARVRVARRRVAEGLLELVDHQDARRHLLGRAQGLVEVLLRLTDVLVVEPPVSILRSGSSHSRAMARATSVFPAPCTPRRRIPLGAASPNPFPPAQRRACVWRARS